MLLQDWRRINVAITRARFKLVIVGSSSTLSSVELFARTIQMCEDRGWMVPLLS